MIITVLRVGQSNVDSQPVTLSNVATSKPYLVCFSFDVIFLYSIDLTALIL